MTNAPNVPRLFDRDRLRARRDKCAPRFDEYDFLKQRVSRDLLERLADTPYQFQTALDLGSHTGALAAELQKRPRLKQCVAADISNAMASAAAERVAYAVVCDEERLPFAPASFDLVVSALSLHWVNDLPGTLIQIRHVLRPDGLFLGALFGAGTLMELRTSLIEAEVEVKGGASQRLSPLPGLQDMAGLMQRAGFALPVVDIERVTVRYAKPMALLRDLGGMGERASFVAQKAGLSRQVLQRMSEIYVERFSDPDGRIRASFEIVYLSGWSPADNQPKPKRPGSATVRLADALGTTEGKVEALND